MDSAKRCRDQSAECLRLMKLAQSETESRILKDLAQSWVRIANQTERYIAFANRAGQPRSSVSIQKPTGTAPSRDDFASAGAKSDCGRKKAQCEFQAPRPRFCRTDRSPWAIIEVR